MGLAAVQLARTMGARVIAVARGQDKMAALRQVSCAGTHCEMSARGRPVRGCPIAAPAAAPQTLPYHLAKRGCSAPLPSFLAPPSVPLVAGGSRRVHRHAVTCHALLHSRLPRRLVCGTRLAHQCLPHLPP